MALSTRSVINPNPTGYPFINGVLNGSVSMSPVGSDYDLTAKTWMQCIDENGWPNDPTARTQRFGFGWRIPDPANYSGSYIIDWIGDGQITIATGTWTVVSSSGVTVVSNGRYKNSSSGTTPRVEVTLSGVTGPQLLSIQILSDVYSTGTYLTNLRMFRSEDETDLNNGLVFRRGWKQYFVALNPAALRMLNWNTWINGVYRFEQRTLPGMAGYIENWIKSPAYGESTGTNDQVVTAVSTGTYQTPISMTHGEVATFRVGNAPTQGNATLTTISNANPGRVTTSAAHGFSDGDIIIHSWGNTTPPGSWGNLNYYPCKVSLVDATHYDIHNIDTTNYDTSTFGAFSGSATTQRYLTLQVGSGSDRIAYPVMCNDGYNPGAHFAGQIATHSYKTFYFDKTIYGQSDGAGNWITTGSWIFELDAGAQDGINSGIPLEILTAMTNEINQMCIAQGLCTCGLWINLPTAGMLTSNDSSFDPDYSAASEIAVNTIDVIMNGANGYSGLGYGADLFVEYSNETWNSAGVFKETPYLARKGLLRWPTSGQADYVDMHALRSTIQMRAIRAANSSSRIKFVMSGQGILGIGSSTLNYRRIHGFTFYNTDSTNTWGTEPIDSHDAFAVATYFDPDNSYCIGQFLTDSSNYASGSAAVKAAAIDSFVSAVQTATSQGINLYQNTLMPAYFSALAALAKYAINYEGGTDWAVAVGGNLGGHTITDDDNTFIRAVINSQQWANAQIGFFNSFNTVSGAAMPSVYLLIGNNTNLTAKDERWSYCMPDQYGYLGDTLANNPTVIAMGERNQLICNPNTTGGGSQSRGHSYAKHTSRPTKIPHS